MPPSDDSSHFSTARWRIDLWLDTLTYMEIRMTTHVLDRSRVRAAATLMFGFHLVTAVGCGAEPASDDSASQGTETSSTTDSTPDDTTTGTPMPGTTDTPTPTTTSTEESSSSSTTSPPDSDSSGEPDTDTSDDGQGESDTTSGPPLEDAYGPCVVGPDCPGGESLCLFANESEVGPSVGAVCAFYGCGGVEDCAPPLSGNATPSCEPLLAGLEPICFLSCQQGEQCPDGMLCLDNFLCAHEPEWTCNSATHDDDDGICHCGCGIQDPDCADGTAASCDVCDAPGTCVAEGAGCEAIAADDNGSCM